jgi:uncharacterized protein YcbK (DUF882 family)
MTTTTMSIAEFAARLATLRIRYPFSVTSWFRTAGRNAMVGGKPHSRHLLGLAADVILDDEERDKASFVEDAKRLGLSVVVEGDHLHVQVP